MSDLQSFQMLIDGQWVRRGRWRQFYQHETPARASNGHAFQRPQQTMLIVPFVPQIARLTLDHGPT